MDLDWSDPQGVVAWGDVNETPSRSGLRPSNIGAKIRPTAPRSSSPSSINSVGRPPAREVRRILAPSRGAIAPMTRGIGVALPTPATSPCGRSDNLYPNPLFIQTKYHCNFFIKIKFAMVLLLPFNILSNGINISSANCTSKVTLLPRKFRVHIAFTI